MRSRLQGKMLFVGDTGARGIHVRLGVLRGPRLSCSGKEGKRKAAQIAVRWFRSSVAVRP
eukprot:4411437-Karenia_brevis.AAC.1